MVDEGALGVHQVELVVDAGEDFGNGGAVRDPGKEACTRVAYPQLTGRVGT